MLADAISLRGSPLAFLSARRKLEVNIHHASQDRRSSAVASYARKSPRTFVASISTAYPFTSHENEKATSAIDSGTKISRAV